MKFIFVTDIHSNIEVLEKLQDVIPEWNDVDTKIVFGGDYVDGFYQSTNAGLKVLEYVFKLVDQGKAIALMGNHDYYLWSIVCRDSDYRSSIETWSQIGMNSSLESWGVNPYDVSDLDELLVYRGYRYVVDWIKSHRLKSFEKLNDNIYVSHAGFDLTKSINDQDFIYSMWVRDQYFDQPYSLKNIDFSFYNKVLVTGHTPISNLPHYIDINESQSFASDHFDQYSMTRYFIDAGSNGMISKVDTDLSVLILNEDGSFVRSELWNKEKLNDIT